MKVRHHIGITLLNRGCSATEAPSGAQTLNVDIENPPAISSALAGESFDVMVDWIAFEPAHVERDIALFRGPRARTSSSARQRIPEARSG